ncbi:MAG: cytochrome c3 family protein [Anaerolineales bacterium]|nr:cytochrome c3 family protein [Anaerolineales bacterium]
MIRGRWFPWFVVGLILVISASGIFLQAQAPVPAASLELSSNQASGELAILTWNDLGMHCYNRDFQDLAVLPPFNTLWVQVVRNGDPPEVVTNGITVSYAFPDNTYSVGKTNFWDYEEMLFGVNLAPNVGLAGKGLSGTMDLETDHFVAVGIPLTEYRDSDLVNPYPYQLATITVRDEVTNNVLASTTVVAPVSSEMRCDNCHYDGAIDDIATGRVETNILTLHDQENAEDYPPGHDTPLMDRRPILCAECHASNALGAPGLPEIPSLSKAMHEKHAGEVTNDLDGCYNCHPGPETQCLRDVMSQQEGMDCIDCHGNMENVSTNPNPWLNEPRCDNTDCHGSSYAQDQPLYRNSAEHGGIYCAACHDSPHAIAPSREANDQIKFINLQGHVGPLDTCTVCHTTQPTDAGPHGIVIPNFSNFLFLPEIFVP